MPYTVDPPITSKGQLPASGDSVPESHAAGAGGPELRPATLSLGAVSQASSTQTEGNPDQCGVKVDTDRSEPATLLSETLDPDSERKLWAATAMRLAGLSLEDERKRVSALVSH